MKFESIEQLTLRIVCQILKDRLDSVYSVRDRSDSSKLIKEAEKHFKYWDKQD